jgi:hypothetical protein
MQLRETVPSVNMSKFDSGACYLSVQNVLSSRMLSKNIKVRIYKTIILSRRMRWAGHVA